MKLDNLLPFLLLLLPAALDAQNFPPPQQPSTLLDILTPAHERRIDVFFAGETWPARPYLHLAYLSARKNGFEELTSLVKNLKKQGQAIGADGVIVMNTEKRIETVVSGEWLRNQEVTDMNALAIVYPENLQFVPGRLKAWKIYEIDSTGSRWELVSYQPYSHKGEALEFIGERTHFDWWKFRLHSNQIRADRRHTTDVYGRIVNYSPKPGVRARVIYENQNNQRIAELRFRSEGVNTETIVYQYDANGKTIRAREIIPAGLPYSIMEYPEYDAEGEAKGYLYQKKIGEHSKQYLRIEAEYYSQEDWDSLVQELLDTQLVP